MNDMMNINFNDISAEMLKVISDYDIEKGFQGAFNIREDTQCAGRKSSANNSITSKTDKPGIDLWSFSRLVETFEDIRGNAHGELIVISHQERILQIADDIIVVADGKIRIMGSREEILPALLQGEYTGACPKIGA